MVAKRKEARGGNPARLAADVATLRFALHGASGVATGYEWCERYEVFSWDDVEWCIMGVAEGRIEELQGPFSSRAGALHFARMSLCRLCPRRVVVIDGLGEA